MQYLKRVTLREGRVTELPADCVFVGIVEEGTVIEAFILYRETEKTQPWVFFFVHARNNPAMLSEAFRFIAHSGIVSVFGQTVEHYDEIPEPE
jgi:hypothetical protein